MCAKDNLCKITAVVGGNFGDEGKGKITDSLADNQDAVIRYAGGANAGHTIQTNGDTIKLSLVPSGILHRGLPCLLGNGMAIDPFKLASEIAELKERDLFRGQFFIGRHAHLVMPYHQDQDVELDGDPSSPTVGTTRRGIGPAYADKCLRVGLRMCDLLNPNISLLLEQSMTRRARIGWPDRSSFDLRGLCRELKSIIPQLTPYIVDALELTRHWQKVGFRILAEGAQGVLLDIDDGTYPFVTSSHPGLAGLFSGTGLSWQNLDRVVGVTKVYCTRVGQGPFPTEDDGQMGNQLRENGDEYGTVTRRPRRTGWLDIPLLRYAAEITGFSELAVTKLDVLDSFDTIKVCTGYRYPELRSPATWPDIDRLHESEPDYLEMPGWKSSTRECRNGEDLPINARNFLSRISDELGLPIRMVSVGPGDKDIVHYAD